MISLVLVFYFLGSINGISTNRVFKAFHLPLFRNQIVTGYVINQFYNIDNVLECLLACAGERSCQSLFYRQSERFCVLNTVTFLRGDTWEPAVGMKHYQVEKLNDDCPTSAGYTYYSTVNLCYKFHISGALKWPDARLVCQREGGDLISLDTMEKYDQIVSTIQASLGLSYRVFYVGATDEVTEGNWRWVSGVELSISSPIWAAGEPNNGGTVGVFPHQNYAVVPAWSGQKMDDATLEDIADFLCEIKLR